MSLICCVIICKKYKAMGGRVHYGRRPQTKHSSPLQSGSRDRNNDNLESQYLYTLVTRHLCAIATGAFARGVTVIAT